MSTTRIFTPVIVGDWPVGISAFSPGTYDDRAALEISEADYARFNGLDRRARTIVTDVPTGQRFLVRHASCGGACYCAAEATLIV